MNKFLTLTKEQRAAVFERVGASVGLPMQAVEKDFWVTVILQAVFSLPVAQHLIFKGGTSLSKAWGLISRFSEDIDLAVNPIALGAAEGDLTKKQIKKLRKASSLFVSEQLTPMLCAKINEMGMSAFLNIEAQPNGEGDNTYPEPRQIYIRYQSVFEKPLTYLRPDVVLEVSARSLIEPAMPTHVSCILADYIPIQSACDAVVHTAIPAKTMVEKMFLLHELFSVPGHGTRAERKSRHLYDLYQMMQQDFAQEAITNDALWESIRHHREVFTSVQGVDYSGDVRQRICLLPREDIVAIWQSDYETMRSSMIHGSAPTWDELIEQITILQNKTRKKLEE
ncbi:MAG: nucleotidyl transferase AbiEii/AbiGii toxin family protein [Paludibacteraceae bacterium]|jgi:predicted nucleotidyltransferase component of viral defense system|nr:nucleotidyl transferase AbiEii/AbiGii toxin family protein [Paludibacteraceae bacterium]